jgi:hypothetical protein
MLSQTATSSWLHSGNGPTAVHGGKGTAARAAADNNRHMEQVRTHTQPSTLFYHKVLLCVNRRLLTVDGVLAVIPAFASAVTAC